MSERNHLKYESGYSQFVKKYLQVISNYKYLFMGSLLLFLFLAFLYQQRASRSYRITTELVLSHVEDIAGKGTGVTSEISSDAQDNRAELLKSKSLIWRAVASMGVPLKYSTNTLLGSTEVYGYYLPIRIIILQPHANIRHLSLQVGIMDQQKFILEENGKETLHTFGESISTSFATLKVKPGPAFNGQAQLIQVDYQDINSLAEDFRQHLSVAVSDHEPYKVSLSLVETSPEKGRDFLEKLCFAYLQETRLNERPLRTAVKVIDAQLAQLDHEILVLDSLTAIHQPLRHTQKNTEAAVITGSLPQTKQLHILNALKPYIKRPVHEYTLIPAGFGLQDTALQNLILEYNSRQEAKQLLLKSNNTNSPLVADSNKRLAALQHDLTAKITTLEKDLSGNNKKQAEPGPEAINDINERLLTDLKRHSKINLYSRLLEKREEIISSISTLEEQVAALQAPATSVLPIKAKAFFIYLLAAILGLSLPLLITNPTLLKLMHQQYVTK
ncbi:hypothetical protein [Pontibacter sp. SGAir0037]|uniref:hypothetical protein n=1 Tax=Pontibacter sp. SGAir0037 TaxID=2571030 RepID=UPI0010CD3072|nr:hypothetical protein [Pontibacter sp. SGAir0037]QCR22535.1 hypothetical protein C1N53_09430 [Pontibacter sp. SGAir0037]